MAGMRGASLLVGIVCLAAVGCDRSSGDAAPVTSGSGAALGAPIGSSSARPAPPAASSTTPAPPPDTIIAQHVLVIYKGAKRAPSAITRSKLDAKVRAAEALAKLQAGTAFEEVVKEYSDDAGSVERMGSLGKFHRDAMDPSFSAAAFALQPNQVSSVVETPFGFHIIKRTQ